MDRSYENVKSEIKLIFKIFSFIIKDRETFFTPAQRSQIAWKIMTRVRFDDGGDEKVGVQLVNLCVGGASFILNSL